MQESKLPEEFSLIKEYNLVDRVRKQQESYPICWAHALAEMITDSVRIYQIYVEKRSSSKRRRIDKRTYINPNILDYVYTTSLIWITSHYGFKRKKFDFLFDTQTYVSSEKCYPFEQTIFKLVKDNPSTHNTLNYLKEAVNVLQPPYFQKMNIMKDKDNISYIDRCKYDKYYDDKLYEPKNRDNELYVNFVFTPSVDKINYSFLFENNLCSVGLFNSPAVNINWEEKQKTMKKILSCDNKIIKAGITLSSKLYSEFLDNLNLQYEGVKYFDFEDFNYVYSDEVSDYDDDDDDDGETKYKEYIPDDIKNKATKNDMVFHKILIYGWIDHDREYWIIRDSLLPNKEYYFPMAKGKDKFFLGLELKYGVISELELSDYLIEKIENQNQESVNDFFKDIDWEL